MKAKIEKILDAGPGIEKIIVSPEQNRDSLTALCLLLGAIGIKSNAGHADITCKESSDITEDDYDNPTIALLGVGGKNNAALRCFDEEASDDANGKSVTGIILRYFDVYDVAVKAHPWVEYMELSFGRSPALFATKMAERIENKANSQLLDFAVRLSKKYTPALQSPIEQWFIDIKHPWHNAEAQELLAQIGRSIFESFNNVTDREVVLEQCRTFYVEGVKVFDSTSIIPGDDNPTKYVNNYLNDNDHDVSVVVSNDDRGEGTSFFRRNEDPSIDFSLLKEDADILYASDEGQLAKTKEKICEESMASIIKRAVVTK